MPKYAILIDHGYGFKHGELREFVIAPNAKQARKKFLERHGGAWYAKPETIRATKVEG